MTDYLMDYCSEHAPRLKEFPRKMLDWYDREKRLLPWREHPTPYRVWISEIMLQQTRVEAVLGYYARFLQKAPDIPTLAALPEEELMKLWEGLGYYSRARNLQKAARKMTELYAGYFPETYDEIHALPGIGDYTAGAIASIAFGMPYPAVDGNVLRVMTRLNANGDDISKTPTKKKIEALLKSILPQRVGDFNQSLMELGATVCVPNGAPRCLLCPVRELCQGYAAGDPEQFPVKPKKKERTLEDRTVFLIEAEGCLALQKRPPKGLLANLWEFPNVPGHLGEQEAALWAKKQQLSPDSVRMGKPCKHIFTHIEWHMTVMHLHLSHKTGGFTWADRQAFEETISLPSAFKGAFKQWE